MALCHKYPTRHCLTGILKWKWIGILEMQYRHTSILISHWRRLLIRCQKWQWKTAIFLVQFHFYRGSLSLFFKFVCPIKVILFMLVDLLKLLCAILGVSLLFLYIWCCTLHSEPLLHACGIHLLQKLFSVCFSVSISWWIHSCVCLIKANSCNMQELWPLNKDNMMY